MRLDHLTFNDFGCYRDLDLPLDERISVFVGESGAGKSSLFSGIRAGLLGTARGLARGDCHMLGSAWGARRWRVDLTFRVGEGTGTISRTATTLSAIRGDKKVAAKQEDILRAIGADEKVLDALLDVSRALSMSASDRKAIVFRLAKIETDDDGLKAAGLTLDDVRGHALAGNWRKAESTAAEGKRAANRAAEEMRAAPVEDPVVGSTTASKVTDEVLAASKARLAELEDQDRKLAESIGAAKATASVGVSALEAQRAGLATELAALEGHEKSLATVRAKLPAAITKTKAAFDAMEDAKQKDGEAHAAVATISDALASLREVGGEHACPLCGLLHASKIAPGPDAIAKAEANLAAARKVEAVAHETLTTAEAVHNDARAALAKLEAEERDLSTGPVARARVMRQQIESLDARIAAAKKNATAGASDIAGMEKELETLRERQAKGRALLSAVDAYRKARAAADATEAKAKALRDEAALYEKQEHLCRPDGLQQALLAPALAPLRERLALWSPLLGYELVLTDDFEVRIRAGEESAPVSMLSKSETWRAGIALADALAQLSGLRWLVLDDAEQLDGGRRAELIGLLAGIADSYDQVLVAGVIGDREPKQAPGGSGIRVYRVAGGKVEAIAAEEAQA